MNKLTDDNLEKMVDQLLQLKFEDKYDRIGAVTQVIFNNAVNNPRYSAAYAKLVINDVLY